MSCKSTLNSIYLNNFKSVGLSALPVDENNISMTSFTIPKIWSKFLGIHHSYILLNTAK